MSHPFMNGGSYVRSFLTLVVGVGITAQFFGVDQLLYAETLPGLPIQLDYPYESRSGANCFDDFQITAGSSAIEEIEIELRQWVQGGNCKDYDKFFKRDEIDNVSFVHLTTTSPKIIIVTFPKLKRRASTVGPILLMLPHHLPSNSPVKLPRIISVNEEIPLDQAVWDRYAEEARVEGTAFDTPTPILFKRYISTNGADAKPEIYSEALSWDLPALQRFKGERLQVRLNPTWMLEAVNLEYILLNDLHVAPVTLDENTTWGTIGAFLNKVRSENPTPQYYRLKANASLDEAVKQAGDQFLIAYEEYQRQQSTWLGNYAGRLEERFGHGRALVGLAEVGGATALGLGVRLMVIGTIAGLGLTAIPIYKEITIIGMGTVVVSTNLGAVANLGFAVASIGGTVVYIYMAPDDRTQAARVADLTVDLPAAILGVKYLTPLFGTLPNIGSFNWRFTPRGTPFFSANGNLIPNGFRPNDPRELILLPSPQTMPAPLPQVATSAPTTANTTMASASASGPATAVMPAPPQIASTNAGPAAAPIMNRANTVPSSTTATQAPQGGSFNFGNVPPLLVNPFAPNQPHEDPAQYFERLNQKHRDRMKLWEDALRRAMHKKQGRITIVDVVNEYNRLSAAANYDAESADPNLWRAEAPIESSGSEEDLGTADIEVARDYDMYLGSLRRRFVSYSLEHPDIPWAVFWIFDGNVPPSWYEDLRARLVRIAGMDNALNYLLNPDQEPDLALLTRIYDRLPTRFTSTNRLFDFIAGLSSPQRQEILEGIKDVAGFIKAIPQLRVIARGPKISLAHHSFSMPTFTLELTGLYMEPVIATLLRTDFSTNFQPRIVETAVVSASELVRIATEQGRVWYPLYGFVPIGNPARQVLLDYEKELGEQFDEMVVRYLLGNNPSKRHRFTSIFEQSGSPAHEEYQKFRNALRQFKFYEKLDEFVKQLQYYFPHEFKTAFGSAAEFYSFLAAMDVALDETHPLPFSELQFVKTLTESVINKGKAATRERDQFFAQLAEQCDFGGVIPEPLVPTLSENPDFKDLLALYLHRATINFVTYPSYRRVLADERFTLVEEPVVESRYGLYQVVIRPDELAFASLPIQVAVAIAEIHFRERLGVRDGNIRKFVEWLKGTMHEVEDLDSFDFTLNGEHFNSWDDAYRAMIHAVMKEKGVNIRVASMLINNYWLHAMMHYYRLHAFTVFYASYRNSQRMWRTVITEQMFNAARQAYPFIDLANYDSPVQRDIYRFLTTFPELPDYVDPDFP